MGAKLSVRPQARLRVPDVPDGLVGRARLDPTYASAAGRVLRVLAPAGYGKSTLVAHWASSDVREVCWVDLESADNDPVVLLNALAQAFEDVPDLAFDSLPQGPMTRDSLRDLLPRRVGELFRACRTPFVLVLDDVHRLDGEEAQALVDALAENLPASSTLVLAGRAHPGDTSIARLRLRPGVVDLGVPDLALTEPESAALLRAMGADLDEAELEAVGRRLEGWPAGLRLAALVLHDDPHVPPPSDEQVGDAAFIVDYLRSEWTGQLDPADLDFLREAAVLGRYTGAMCDSVLGRTGSAALLRRLHREQLVVLPLDRRDEWYRMHALLTRWLSADLRDLDPPRWREIHLAAAGHWAAAGDIDLAMRHAETGGDLELCERLVTEHAARYFSRGMRLTVERWLTTFRTERVRSSAALCGIGALSALQGGDGRRALHWSRLLVRNSATPGDAAAPDADRDGVPRRSDVLFATLEPRPAGELLRRLEPAYEAMPSSEWRGLACWTRGGLLFLVGDERCVDTLDEGAFEAELAGAPMLRANCLATAGIVLDLAGDVACAEGRLREAQRGVAELRSELAPTAAALMSMAALVEARHGRRDLATHDLEVARSNLVGYDTVAPWFNVLARLALVPAALRLDEPSVAGRLLRELEHHVGLDPTAVGARACVAQLRERVDAAAGLVVSPESLTDAERRVLQYLPTNLSLADIATRLYVSRNTVKSHAAAIYRKLDATSRGGAVEIARVAGLIDDRPS